VNRFLNFSSSIYRKLLWVCPEELRRDFGADMELVFAYDIGADSWLEGGIPGVIRVWRCAACERLRIRVVKHCIHWRQRARSHRGYPDRRGVAQSDGSPRIVCRRTRLRAQHNPPIHCAGTRHAGQTE